MRTFAFLIALALWSVGFAQDKPAAAPATPATAQPGPTGTPLPDTPPPAAKAAPKPAAAAPAAAAPAAKPVAAPASAPAPAATVTTKPVAVASEPKAKPMSQARKAKREEDARHCLEKTSNDEIIKCAEAYL